MLLQLAAVADWPWQRCRTAGCAKHVIASSLGKQKVPERFEFVAELPRTPSGKVRKGVLRDTVRALRAGGGGLVPDLGVASRPGAVTTVAKDRLRVLAGSGRTDVVLKRVEENRLWILGLNG